MTKLNNFYNNEKSKPKLFKNSCDTDVNQVTSVLKTI